MSLLNFEIDPREMLIDSIQAGVHRALRYINEHGGIEANQTIAYDAAHIASALDIARAGLPYAKTGDAEERLFNIFLAQIVAEFQVKAAGREDVWQQVAIHNLGVFQEYMTAHRDPQYIAAAADAPGDARLDDEFALVADTFRRFALEKVRPHAEHVHRTNGDVPEEIIRGLAELGGFGLSVPEEFGGMGSGDANEYLGMVIATENLSWGSLGIGGSLITRPEILARALMTGGTTEQKKHWLPKLANAEILSAVAVTEPDYGSDVANLTTSATRVDGGWVISGTKTWCTFAARADVLMLLARTEPDRSLAHKGLSLFIVEKPRGDAHGFAFTQDNGGKMEGRPIDTLGYRGMHSYELSFDNWFVPSSAMVGEEAGRGRGFYLQMAGFENGRIQTAARAVGVMQAAYEAALDYAKNRVVFGKPIFDYELTRVKLGTMAAIIQMSRQYSLHVARLMGTGGGTLEASMIKAYVCKAAEWVTREAMQIHGGMGYAEEYAVSRYFVDARVLSIFEGADETLSLRLIAKDLTATVPPDRNKA